MANEHLNGWQTALYVIVVGCVCVSVLLVGMVARLWRHT
jgi:hypothetical protein